MTNDKPIHLGQNHVTLEVTLTQDNLDGLCSLIHWCEGFEKAGNGVVDGQFELIMHYRSLRSAINEKLKD